MALIGSTISSKLLQIRVSKDTTSRSLYNHVHVGGRTTSINSYNTKQNFLTRLLVTSGGHFRCLSQPIAAARSGLETSTTKPKDLGVTIKDAKIVVESRDGDIVKVRVDLTGKETQKVFDDVLTNLARTSPPIPGFRRSKGGKTSNVPKDFLLRAIGENRVINFVMHEIVSTTMSDFVKKENLTAKKEFKTVQSAEELESAFEAGKEFGFNATLEIENPETEATGESSSDGSNTIDVEYKNVS